MFFTQAELNEIQALLIALKEHDHKVFDFEVKITDSNGENAGEVSFDPFVEEYVWRLVG